MAYIQAPADQWAKMDNETLVEAFDVCCATICNAHTYSRRGPTKAMRADFENCKAEILRRMKEV